MYSTTFLSRPAIVKERVSKAYRARELDQRLNRQRLLQEARCMVKCRRGGVLTPSIYLVDEENGRLILEKIIGKTLKELLQSSYAENHSYPTNSLAWAREVGIILGRMHDMDVVHGDLTTSNIMIRNCCDNDTSNTVGEGAFQIVMIDFGLGQMQSAVEEKAVDLYVLERAFTSTHPDSDNLVSQVLEGYRFGCRKGTPVLQKLEQVRLRGRKREAFG